MTESDDDLVDDPFSPGQKVQRWASKVWPGNRLGEAVARHYEAVAAAKSGRQS